MQKNGLSMQKYAKICNKICISPCSAYFTYICTPHFADDWQAAESLTEKAGSCFAAAAPPLAGRALAVMSCVIRASSLGAQIGKLESWPSTLPLPPGPGMQDGRQPPGPGPRSPARALAPATLTWMFNRWHCARRVSSFTRAPDRPGRSRKSDARSGRHGPGDYRCIFLLCATCMLPSLPIRDSGGDQLETGRTAPRPREEGESLTGREE